ncbi:MAG TPA: potassium-transporting ATPase subunit KdpA, partial [Ohtaekwangia sp.]|uniref:potassium-transporting ATPase subunit KdpA n=1 Tax=Ohtaekwangia sp. TaxID=2066019 RepID=UPI002F931E52
MNTEIVGVVFILALTVALAIPLGKYIAKVYAGERTLLDPVFNPLEKLFFRISRIDAAHEMTWKEHLVALLIINIVWFVYGMLILMNQGWLPLNPDGNPSMTPDLAFNTVISFVTNTNLQHYSGESGVSYLGQLTLMLYQFVSAGAGMAVAAVLFNALRERTTDKLGNFYEYFVKSCTRILLPVSFIVAVILVFSGTPMTFAGKDTITSLQGDTVQVSRGPAAAMIAIKQVGTNGGGFYGANSAHPLENPNFITNIVETIAIPLLSIALVFALGYYLKRQKLAWMIFGVMTAGFLLFLIPTIYLEMQGNPAITKLGIDQSLGSMEGKEVRFGSAASALWAIVTTCTSNGSVNAMHDSLTPLSGMFTMLGMQINAFYGGKGVGLLNFYIFIIIAVFISGLMVGRTPEFLGKKIEVREMKIAMIVFLLHPLLILTGTALSSYILYMNQDYAWLNNPSYHGFSEMLYEYTSSSANNGSGFEGLGDNTPWWNISCGIIMLLARFIPIIGPIAIAGILANKKYIPESAGTLKADTGT